MTQIAGIAVVLAGVVLCALAVRASGSLSSNATGGGPVAAGAAGPLGLLLAGIAAAAGGLFLAFLRL
jgi:hypothetical protein